MPKSNVEKAKAWIQPKIYIATSLDILKEDAEKMPLVDFNKKYNTDFASEVNLRAKMNQTYNWLKRSKSSTDKKYHDAFKDAWSKRIPPKTSKKPIVSSIVPPVVSTVLSTPKYPKHWRGSFSDGGNVITYYTNVNYYMNASNLHIYSAQCDYSLATDNKLVLKQQYEIAKQYIGNDPDIFEHHRLYLEVRNEKNSTVIGTKFKREPMQDSWTQLDKFFYDAIAKEYRFQGFTFEISNY